MAKVSIRRSDSEAAEQFRWNLAGDSSPQDALFPGLVDRELGRGEFRGLEFLHVEAKSIINDVPAAAGLPFRYTINPYRGCSHGCSYCFSRPTHEYLNLDTGADFDSKIVVKVNAVERLRAELAPKRWAGEPIAMGTNTDPYQRAEGKYRLTRGIVETFAEFANPFSILTKSTLILRDLDALLDAAGQADVATNFSVGTLDEEVWKLTEPGTPHPMRRIEAVAKLNEAGIPCGVLVAPVIPGLSDAPEQLDAVVAAAVDAGATSITPITLHLRPKVREHFLGWLREQRPDLLARYREIYGRRRSYASEGVQQTITDRVMRAVERHGGLPAEPPPLRRGRRDPDPVDAPESEPEPQLSLGL